HRRLHVVPAALQLAEDPLGGHLALEVLDRALDPLVAHGDLERLALDGFGRHRNVSLPENASCGNTPGDGGRGPSHEAAAFARGRAQPCRVTRATMRAESWGA